MLRPPACVRLALSLVALGAGGSARAADAPAAPAVHKVKLVPFRVEARVEGIFESPAMAEVRLEPKRWSQFVVAEAVPHGTRVGKGDVLVKIETDKLDEAIQDQEIGGRIAALAHALMERELAALEKSTPRQLELARRARRIAEENRKRYEEKERELATANNDLGLAWSKQSRENAEEELAQLEKMYEQDDLTEETEAIVLKRARFQAEVARFFERLAKDEHERAATLDLPRALESVRLAAEAAVLDNERAEAALPLTLDKLRLELEKTANERRKAAEQLAELKADRHGLPITAPADGVVYYGRWRQGKWIDGDAAAQRLRPGGQLDPRETVITVVGPGKLHLRAIVAEKDLGRVPVAAATRILPRAFPEPPLAGRVRSVASVPVGPGRFEAVIDLVDDPPRLVAGMEADVRVTADQRAEVLAVPRKAVFTDEFDDGRRYVLVFTGAGQEPMKRTVTVGRSNDELTEITAGLSVGEEILLDKPSPAAPKQDQAAAKPEAAAKPDAAKPDAAAAPAKEAPKPAADAPK
jgi:multidrug efflux pump subunit AcrA (membrane-fusion protein)